MIRRKKKLFNDLLFKKDFLLLSMFKTIVQLNILQKPLYMHMCLYKNNCIKEKQEIEIF